MLLFPRQTSYACITRNLNPYERETRTLNPDEPGTRTSKSSVDARVGAWVSASVGTWVSASVGLVGDCVGASTGGVIGDVVGESVGPSVRDVVGASVRTCVSTQIEETSTSGIRRKYVDNMLWPRPDDFCPQFFV